MAQKLGDKLKEVLHVFEPGKSFPLEPNNKKGPGVMEVMFEGTLVAYSPYKSLKGKDEADFYMRDGVPFMQETKAAAMLCLIELLTAKEIRYVSI
jgi:hypothetical protein